MLLDETITGILTIATVVKALKTCIHDKTSANMDGWQICVNCGSTRKYGEPDTSWLAPWIWRGL